MAPRKNVQPVPQATEMAAISIDLGNAYSNLQASGGISADWRSIQGVVSENSRMGQPVFDAMIHYDNEWRVFGEMAPTYSARIEDFATTDRYTSAWYKRLFAYSLHRAYGKRFSESPFYPKVIASIPAKEYAIDERVQQVRANLLGPYVIGDIHGNTLQVDVLTDNLTIIPEGAGAYFSMLKANDGRSTSPYARGLWYVLDLGYLTADIVAFNDAEYMPDSAASKADLGMRSVATQVAKSVRGAGGPDLDPAHYDSQLRCDAILANGRSFPIAEVRDRALCSLGERITRFLQSQASGQNLSGILLAGGGAELLDGYINAPGLPVKMRVPNSRRANVEGAFKLLTE
jgi:hypothetical protein